MKFKTTIILFAIFIALLGFFFFFERLNISKKKEEEKLVSLPKEDIQKIAFKTDDENIVFEKEKEEWLIKVPLEAKADGYEVNRLAENFCDLKIERVVEKDAQDLEKYGIPGKEIKLYSKGKEQPLTILIGNENPIDKTFFAKREDETRVVLIPSYLSSLLDNKVFDFRQKDIFKFETDEVKRIKLRAKEITWDGEKREDEWFLTKPVEALARKSRIEDILYSLSNLKAKEFISEKKTDEELKSYRLQEPEYEIVLSMPSKNQEVTFLLNKKDEKLYATTSLSTKIISIEDYILSDLEKKVEELREKKVADFYAWEVNRIYLKKGEIEIDAEKGEGEKWHLKTQQKQELEKDKLEAFIRKIEGLEAEEFIDPPFKLEDYGLVNPQGQIKIGIKEKEKLKEIVIFLGKEDSENKKIFVKNERLGYLFLVPSSFLDEFPKTQEEWIVKKEKKD